MSYCKWIQHLDVRVPSRAFSLIIISTLLTACVTPITLEQQTPDLVYVPDGAVQIAVIDKRERVTEGKSPTFIGKAHGPFGIPADWHVSPVLSTEEGDKEKTLAEFLQNRLTAGMRESGWKASEHDLNSLPSNQAAIDLLRDTSSKYLIALVLNEWYFSINLNWVSAFNFDSDVNIHIFQETVGAVHEQRFTDRDVIDEQANQSPQNLILGAYRDQLRQILNEPAVQGALKNSAGKSTLGYTPQPTTEIASQLRAVNETEKDNCSLVKTVTVGSGGSGDPSVHAETAMKKALVSAANAGADSYFVVKMESNGAGASVVLEALKCD